MPRALTSIADLINIFTRLIFKLAFCELDYFIKHNLRVKHYIRYCDDFVILDNNREHLQKLLPEIDNFLKYNLKLSLHPDKIIIRKYHQGIDFLGYVSFSHHRILRTKTKRRIFRGIRQKVSDLKGNKITAESFNQTIQSYLGILKHCNSYKLKTEIERLIEVEGLIG